MTFKSHHNSDGRQEESPQNPLDALRGVCLTEDEKREGRDQLVAFMNENPLPAQEVAREGRPQRSAAWAVFKRLVGVGRPKAIASMLVVLMVVSGGGISYAAESSLPGEWLYSVKVNVNEEVRSLLAFSDQDKLDWELTRMERRIEEYEALDQQGALTEEINAELSQNIQASGEEVHAIFDAVNQGADPDEPPAWLATFSNDFGDLFEDHEEAWADLFEFEYEEDEREWRDDYWDLWYEWDDEEDLDFNEFEAFEEGDFEEEFDEEWEEWDEDLDWEDEPEWEEDEWDEFDDEQLDEFEEWEEEDWEEDFPEDDFYDEAFEGFEEDFDEFDEWDQDEDHHEEFDEFDEEDVDPFDEDF